jgi:DNA-binding transcriptional MerR regulator
LRIAELSSRSGTSIPTIKYYLREGLLPAGAATGRNQADYAEQHVHRLRLIRALIDVGGLSVAAARDVLAALDSAQMPDGDAVAAHRPRPTAHELLGITQHALVRVPGRDRDNHAWRAARDEIVQLVRDHGWQIHDDSPNLDQAADAIAAMRTLGQADLLDCLPVYFAATQQIAAKEVAAVIRRGDPGRMVEGVVTGTILGEALIAAVRRLAHEHTSAVTLDNQ